MLRLLLLADTHLRADRVDRLPSPVVEAARSADVILHAGDVVSGALLERLAELAPVHAVCGNNDHELAGVLPERLELELDGVTVAMVHDSGARKGRGARLQRWFPDADVVVFGHSHQPCAERVDGGLLLVNPGSATQRRREPHATYALVDLEDGGVQDVRHVIVDRP
jgi:putative phosphoesterase